MYFLPGVASLEGRCNEKKLSRTSSPLGGKTFVFRRNRAWT